MNAIPPYLTPAQIAEACRDPLLTVTTRSIRRKLDRAGILEPDGPHRWHVAASRLAEKLPDLYDRVVGHFALRLNDDAAH